jgi:hypothetical protein
MKPLWRKCRLTFPAINFWVIGLRHNQTETRAGLVLMLTPSSRMQTISSATLRTRLLSPAGMWTLFIPAASRTSQAPLQRGFFCKTGLQKDSPPSSGGARFHCVLA